MLRQQRRTRPGRVADPGWVCRDPMCRRLADLRERLPAPAFAAEVTFQQGLRAERARRSREADAARMAVRERERQEHANALNALLEAEPDLADNPPMVVGVPSGLTGSVPLAADRIDRYRDFVRSLVERCFDADHAWMDDETDRERDDDAGLQAVCAAMCTLCGGGCCSFGGDHAHLSQHAMQRVVRRNRQRSVGEIVDMYLAYVPRESIANSCINQTRSGCALPRELRSDTCNAFFCEGVGAYRSRATEGRAPHRVYVIQRNYAQIGRFHPDTRAKIVARRLIATDRNDGLSEG